MVRHELRDVVRDGRFQWASIIVGGLLSLSIVTGWSYQRTVTAQHESAARESREMWLAQPAKDPHTAAHYGAYAFKPRGALRLFDSGIDAYAGVAAFLEAHKQNEFQFRPAQDRGSMARLGQFTAAAVLQQLLPLLIFLLTFTKFAGEREDGTLRQLAASGISMRHLTMGKVAGVGAALGLVLIPATLVGVIALLLATSTQDEPLLVRGSALVALYVVYLAGFILVGLAVSIRVSRSSYALAILLAFWAASVVIAPRLASDLSRRAYPSPTAFELNAAVQHDTYDGLSVHAYNLKRAADLRARLLAEHGVQRLEELPVNFRGIDYLEREAHSDAIWDQQFGRVWDALTRQTHLHQLVGVVAPVLSARAWSSALTGTDFFHHQHFAAAAEAYRRQLVRTMNGRLAFGGSSERLGAYTAESAFWGQVAPFGYRQPPLGWALSNVITSLAGLALWIVVGTSALGVAIMRIAVE